MTIKARTIAEYVKQIPEDRQQVFEKLLSILRENLPPGFEECLSYGMPAFRFRTVFTRRAITYRQRLHYRSLVSPRKKTLSPFTTWACMPLLNSIRGGKRNTPSILNGNWIWEKAACDLRRWTTSRLNSFKNWPRKYRPKNGLQRMKSNSRNRISLFLPFTPIK